MYHTYIYTSDLYMLNNKLISEHCSNIHHHSSSIAVNESNSYISWGASLLYQVVHLYIFFFY